MSSFRSLCCLLLSSVAFANVLPRNITTTAPKVTLKNGSYYGIQLPNYEQDIFLGIPFAQPPIDSLRFRQPQPLNTTWDDVRNATVYQPQCFGYGAKQWVFEIPFSEDCLSVNIIRPAGISTDAALPVGVFINPGGYLEGGNSDPRYNMSFIVQQSQKMGTPFIAVSPNYRLSVWGFLYSQEVVDAGTTNLGMLDQRLALHWIQENIAAFGGDPRKVTIWGESAGAGAVGTQLVAYGGRDDKLFRGAISESGSCSGLEHYPTIEEWQPVYDLVVNETDCAGAADSLDCLRTIPTSTLNNIFNTSGIGSSARFGPQIDGDFLQVSGTTQLRRGEFVKVPYLLGSNFDEGTSIGTKGINTTEQFRNQALVKTPGMDNETLNTVAALYPDIPEIGIPATLNGRPSPESGYGQQWKREAAYKGDVEIHAARRHATQSWARYNATAYSYRFNVLVNGAAAEIGATHFNEVAFVFHDVIGTGYNNSIAADPFLGQPDTFVQLATMMSRMWVSFIVHGDPNYSGVTDLQWPKYTLEDSTNIVFDVNQTGLAYTEPDMYRAEGIKYIIDHMETVFRQ